jgi:peptidoglycan DL-endopeptidase CwlO
MGPVRPVVAAAVALALLAAAAPAGAATLGGWSAPQQRAVVRAGLLDRYADRAFHGERSLTVAQLRHALGALAALRGAERVATPGRGTVPVDRFDARLVAQLGLTDVAKHVQATAHDAGLRPPARFGTEVVARQLGLRHNFASRDDALELFPWDPITRAEAAWSLARALALDDGQVQAVRAQLAAFTLPRYGRAQRDVLRIAVGKIGMPYIWGGQADGTYSSIGGPQLHGGYDCSGFVWRVYKLSLSRWSGRIQGRTAAQQAAETAPGRRLRLRQVRGGDLLFFGSARFTSRPTERNVTHVGIALSPTWMIQSSAQGVYLGSLTEPWRVRSFAWGRRIL